MIMQKNMTLIEKQIEQQFQNNLECLNKIKKENKIYDIIEELIKNRDEDKRIYICGNGGSASTATHFASDLLKTAIMKDEKRFNVTSLTDNIPVILAWANDSSFDNIFVEQLKNSLKDGDIIIGFSGSGNSTNVIKALEYGKQNNAKTIGITGMSGGNFPQICDICFIIPSNDMLIIESMHLAICHIIISTIRSLGNPLFTYE